MTLDEYQKAAARTRNVSLNANAALADAAAGLAEESGEVLGLVRKHLYAGKPLDRAKLIEELGDALWCLAAVATSLDVSLDDVAASNIAKLRARYPDGFTLGGTSGHRDP